ncbi:FAD-binding oxidoreductase [Nereida sp. MMG025]|uniref:NAD(P)/FAD-dependent oxidoreductase n=1 Tax=Nereida sp. MMG025 TaxID=2909981 RepID=UPI001F1F37F1|nr:FAD-binding oxidoreductase [Nereida sp. MMG025]MCF6443843.1 FAD-binding oxidoreductase [Nereida sp. MMG025]
MSRWLFANEPQGHYPSSWYAQTCEGLAHFDPLRGEAKAELCVIGAGFTGLSAALHAALSGMSVIVLDAHRVGWGASGRNGGQVGRGWNWDLQKLTAKFGRGEAEHFERLAIKARQMTLDLMAQHAPDAQFQAGLLAASFAQAPRDQPRVLKTLNGLGHTLSPLDANQMAGTLGTKAYQSGVLDTTSGYCNPLAYAFGLARACVAAGVVFHERSTVHKIAPGMVQTDAGRVTARFTLNATNGYGAHLTRKTAARVLPINNYMAATEPLGLSAPITRPVAVFDDKFVLNYFWQTQDGRLIYGGGESYGRRFPRDIAARVRKNLMGIYPDLSDVTFTHTWGGTLAVTATRLPYVADLGDGLFTSGGYSGHGLVLGSFCGALCVDAMLGKRDDFDCVGRLPTPALPGGSVFGGAITSAAMRWMALKDWVRRN